MEPEPISRADKAQNTKLNGFLKPSNSHTIGSPVDVRVQGLDDEQALVWHKQSQPYKIPKRKGKRKSESLLAVFCQWIVEHQIGKRLFVAHRSIAH